MAEIWVAEVINCPSRYNLRMGTVLIELFTADVLPNTVLRRTPSS